jgi:aspartyl-tRNA(Asn)/glutamyl-tRNA(Gln) amidotransferase subunit C
MATINRAEVEKLSQLCRIGCSDQEIDSLLGDLKKILSYVEQLDEVDTENVPPCNQVLEGMANVTREDTPGTPMPREVFLANAPDKVSGLIRVPTVIKKREG